MQPFLPEDFLLHSEAVRTRITGEIPADFELVGNMVGDICWRNAAQYFGIAMNDNGGRLP